MKIVRFIGIACLAALALPIAGIAQGSDRENDDEKRYEKHKEKPHLNIDSLLTVYYMQRELGDSIIYPDLDSSDAMPIADLPDSVYIARLGKIVSPVNLPYNDVIRRCIIGYTQKWKKKSELILGLAEYYMPYFEEIFDMYNLPLELRAMAVIESGLDPVAVSRAKATGMWQFMYRTGKQYNLNVTSYVDDRCDPIASAHAAAKYLRDLYNIFGDWTLAIAAYNCGDGNVRKAIRRADGKRDYWAIYPYLPRETRSYVPLFIGATYMLNYYKEHNLRPINAGKPIQTDTIMVNQMLHFEQIASVIDIPVDVLRSLNPQYKKDVIPGKEKPYALRLPYNYTTAFIDNEKEIYSYKDSTYFNPKTLAAIASSSTAGSGNGKATIHKVVKGDTPGSIAKRYGVKLADLRDWNNLGSKSVIRIGQKLSIYK